jgi:UDP-N-acetylmuramate--alanine ligase
MRKSIIEIYDTFYLSGICGVSMSAIAKHLLTLGKNVSGSDKDFGKTANQLKELGIKVYKGNKKEHLQKSQTQVLVYTSAIKEDSEELLYAKQQGIVIIKRSELLGEILASYPVSIGVSGSHGKTTATAMIAKVLENSNLSLAVFLGGNDIEFGNYKHGKNMVVAEACEYKKNFLDLKPTYSVVLNVDNDHMECYKNQEDLIKTFNEFTKNTISVINADDKNYEKLTNEIPSKLLYT